MTRGKIVPYFFRWVFLVFFIRESQMEDSCNRLHLTSLNVRYFIFIVYTPIFGSHFI